MNDRRHPCYVRSHFHRPRSPGDIKRILSRGPWFWPATDDWEAIEVAREVMGAEAVPDDACDTAGCIPVVAYQKKQGGSIWIVDLSVTQSTGEHHEFLREAKEVWRDVISAVPRSIPVLWKPLREMTKKRLWAGKAVQFNGASVLDGRSFGLAFALALISKLLEAPIPLRFMASADVDEMGHIRAVDGLEEKLEVIWNYAPRVEVLLVAKEQEDNAREYADGRLEVKGVATLTEAVDLVFDDLPRQLVEAGEGEAERDELVEEIFRLCLLRRDSIVDWSPVGRAARLAREGWDGLSESDTQKLAIAEAVARRHQDNSGQLELPSQSWIDELPQPQRVEVVAHIVQQATDTGTLVAGDALEFGRRYLVRGVDAFGPHLKLLGALGRLYFVMGELEQALEMQKEAIGEWIRRRRSDEISYPLSFAYTLVGALGDGDEFEELSKLETRWRSMSGATPRGDDYVRCFRGRAAALLGDLESAEEWLEQAADASGAPGPFRRFLDRWRLYVLEEIADGDSIDESREARHTQIVESYGWGGAPDCHQTWWLAMTRALRSGAGERAVECARAFIDAEDKIAGRLVEYGECSDEELPEFLLRRYPY